MGDLSKNLSRHEMACECGCGFDTADILLVDILQDVADYFSDMYSTVLLLQITGGNRCPYHNEVVQLAANADYPLYTSKSQHLYGRAADFKLFSASGKQVDPDEVYNYLDARYPNKFGFGLYNNRNHADSRTNGPARWDKRGDS